MTRFAILVGFTAFFASVTALPGNLDARTKTVCNVEACKDPCPANSHAICKWNKCSWGEW
jgi:hypothetical protein